METGIISIGNTIKKYYLKLLVFSVSSQKDKHFQCFIRELGSLGSQGDACQRKQPFHAGAEERMVVLYLINRVFIIGNFSRLCSE